MEQVQKIMSTWSSSPLFERKEGKNETLLNLDDRTDRLKKRYDEIAQAGEKIHGLVKVSCLITHHTILCYLPLVVR